MLNVHSRLQVSSEEAKALPCSLFQRRRFEWKQRLRIRVSVSEARFLSSWFSLSDCVSVLNCGINVRKGDLWWQRSRGMTDPLEMVAEEIAEESILLCIDEFMVCF